MKNIIKPFIGIMLLVAFQACDKHDFIDDNAVTGNVGPQAYWEIESSAVNAGSKMPFNIQYYSSVSDIDHAEVWYSVIETIEKKVSCEWVSSYVISSIKSDEQRISQKIQEYSHSLAVWSDTLHAYSFESEFPVASTLSPFSWVNPSTFNEKDMVKYFGTGFMEHFKDSLYTVMKFEDFKKMMLGTGILEDFKEYTDSTKDEIASINAGEDVWIYHFPKDSQNNYPVPEEVKNLYNEIPFAQLIQGGAGYNIEYKRTYSLDAVMRVYDIRGVYGTTTSKKIDIN